MEYYLISLIGYDSWFWQPTRDVDFKWSAFHPVHKAYYDQHVYSLCCPLIRVPLSPVKQPMLLYDPAP